MKQLILLKKLALFVLMAVSLCVIASAEEPISGEDLTQELVCSYAEDVDLDVSDWAAPAVSFFSLSPYDQMKASIVEQLQSGKQYLYVTNLLDTTCTKEQIKQLYFNALYSFPEETSHVEVTRVSHTTSAAPGKDIVFMPVYLDDSVYDGAAFEAAVDAAEAACFREGMTDLEKMVAVHDWLVLNCQYDPYVANGEKEYTAGGVTYKEKRTVYSAYGVFVEGNAVCQGYALAFQALMNRAGIPCYFVSGLNHAWNVVPLEDEQGDVSWYYVDVTWDDPVNIGERGDLYGHVRRANFLRGETSFRSTKAENESGHDSCAPWSTEYGTQLNISEDDYALPAGLKDAADMAAYLIDDTFYLAKEGVLYQYEIGSGFEEGVQVADGLPETIVSTAWDEDGRTLYFLSSLFYKSAVEPISYYQYLYKYELDGTEESAEKILNTPPVTELKQYTIRLSEAENGTKELWTWYNYSSVDTLLTVDYYVGVEEGGYSYYTEDNTVSIKRDKDAENMVLVIWLGSSNEFLRVDFCAEDAVCEGPKDAKTVKILAVGDLDFWLPLCTAIEQKMKI